MKGVSTVIVFLILLSGCSSMQEVSSLPETLFSLRATYAVDGYVDGLLEIQVLPVRNTLDSSLEPHPAVPIAFTGWHENGSLKAHSVFWIDGSWTIVRVDEYCWGSWDPCGPTMTLFGARGAPPPFGIAHLGLLEEPRLGYDGTPADLIQFVRSSSGSHVTYETSMYLNAQKFQLPNGTFTYDGGLLPVRYEGLLIPYGDAVAELIGYEPGTAFQMPPPWPVKGADLPATGESRFFPGEDADPYGIGVTVMDAWQEITKHAPDLVAKAEAGCINAVSVNVNFGGSAAIVANVEEYNYSGFSFSVDGSEYVGERHDISTYDHWLQGRQWRMQDARESPAYGRCPYESQRVSPVIDAAEFVAKAQALPRLGTNTGLAAFYWDDVVQPFGITHERGRFSQTYRTGSMYTFYLEMDMTSGQWYRLFGDPADMEELGAMPWNGQIR